MQTTKTQGKAWPVDEESGKPIPYNVHAVPLSHNALQVMGNSSAPSKAFKDDFYSRHRLHINERTSYQNDMGHGMRSKVDVYVCIGALTTPVLYIELTTLPLPLYDEDGVTQQTDADDNKLTVSCPEWQAIFNPRPHRFQSGRIKK